MKTVSLPFRLKKPILACGADLKSAFAIAEGSKAFLVDSFGDLSDPGNLARYGDAVRKYAKKLGIKPKVIACDLHPSYFSTKFAEAYTLRPLPAGRQVGPCTLYRVQHHEAHVASAIIDNSIKGDVIGVAFDGTGFGLDGNIWGGEFFVGSLKGLKRAGHLSYIPMPGGEIAIHQPWRMAVGYLYNSLGSDFLKLKIEFVKKLDKKSWVVLRQMMEQGVNSPLTSSMGRLFDAVGSIVLARESSAFEAQLPIMLEDIADRDCGGIYGFDLRPDKGVQILDVSRTIRCIVKDLSKKVDTSIISAKFHNTVAAAIVAMAGVLSKKYGIRRVVLTGGVFQNSYLNGKAIIGLKERGFKVYTHSNIPTNDGGVPVGQVVMAGCRL